MNSKLELNKDDILNGDNFEDWYIKINNILTAKKLSKYIRKNMLENYKDVNKLDKVSRKKIQKG